MRGMLARVLGGLRVRVGRLIGWIGIVGVVRGGHGRRMDSGGVRAVGIIGGGIVMVPS